MSCLAAVGVGIPATGYRHHLLGPLLPFLGELGLLLAQLNVEVVEVRVLGPLVRRQPVVPADDPRATELRHVGRAAAAGAGADDRDVEATELRDRAGPVFFWARGKAKIGGP